MSKPETLRQRPLRPDEFYFSAPVVGGNHEQLTGYGRIGHGIMPCVDMTLVLPDGLPLSVLSVDVSMPSGAQVRPFFSVSFAPLQPGEAQQARDAMKAAGWTVAADKDAKPVGEPEPSEPEPSDADLAEGESEDDGLLPGEKMALSKGRATKADPKARKVETARPKARRR